VILPSINANWSISPDDVERIVGPELPERADIAEDRVRARRISLRYPKRQWAFSTPHFSTRFDFRLRTGRSTYLAWRQHKVRSHTQDSQHRSPHEWAMRPYRL
jgi:hypothetical protein